MRNISLIQECGQNYSPDYLSLYLVAPQHLLLVCSLHRNDQQAAVAEELEKRFATLGLQVQANRFRDDSRWLVRWHTEDENRNEYYRLPQLLAWRCPFIDRQRNRILSRPYSGEIRSWLKEFPPWQDKVWLHPRDAAAKHATELAQRNFLVLPLCGIAYRNWSST
jgi:hypothetical protein